MTKKIAVIDGNSLMHRAFHAVPPTMNAPDGTPTNAAFGFMSMLLKFIDDAAPDAIICAFDAGRPAFRVRVIEQYKAQRPPMDAALKVQFPIIEELLESMNIPVIKIPGWEGDDILGTIAARDDILGFETLLVTGDKDAYQLASDTTRIVTTRKGITDVVLYGPAEVQERYGIMPEQVPDFLGLKGDPSDNIPGVPGIGEKTAAKLLQQYGTLEGLYESVGELKGKQKERIEENRDAAFASRKVATIVRDLDFECDLEGASFPSFDVDRVSEAFGKVKFNSHLTRVCRLVGAQRKRSEMNLVLEPVKKGEEGIAAVDKALAEKSVLGVSFVDNEVSSLFEGALFGAFAFSDGVALLEDEKALEAFARVVRQGSFVSCEVKGDLQRVYPPDGASPALIEDEDILGMDAFDIGLAGYVLDSSRSDYDLESLAEAYGNGTVPSCDGAQQRAVARAAASLSLLEPLTRALADDGTADAFEKIDMPLVGVLAMVERTGAKIDCARLGDIAASTGIELSGLRKEIFESAGEEFNIDSPRQLAHILFEVLDLTPRRKTQRGYSTDASVLKELESDHELPALVSKYRELAKIKSTYIDALPKMRKGDDRVHTSFNEKVTTTGRLSSSDPNLQNIPVRTDFGRKIRECFVALDEGDLFVSADYSQIELRLLAHLSGDEHLIEAFCSGADFHAATASRVFGVPIEEVTSGLRSRAKAVNFGIVYGQQAYGLSQSLGIPFGEAKNMIDRYFEAYPGVRRYLDETVREATRLGYAETMFGRKRHIAELRSTNANTRGFGERTAMNHPMQGSAADIIKLAMTEVQRRLVEEDFESKLMLQVHDELDFSVPENELERLRAMVGEVMSSVVELKVPLVVDVSAGKNWAEAH